MSEPKLKPCPFCGGEAVMLTHSFFNLNETFGVQCAVCEAETNQFYHTKEEAAEAWNRKVQDEPQT